MAQNQPFATTLARQVPMESTDEFSASIFYAPVFTGDSRFIADYDIDKTDEVRVTIWMLPENGGNSGYATASGRTNQGATNDGHALGCAFGSGTRIGWGGVGFMGTTPDSTPSLMLWENMPASSEYFASNDGTALLADVGGNSDAVNPFYIGSGAGAGGALSGAFEGRIEDITIEVRDANGYWQVVRHWSMSNYNPDTEVLRESITNDHATLSIEGTLTYEVAEYLSTPTITHPDLVESTMTGPHARGYIYPGAAVVNQHGTNIPAASTMRFSPSYYVDPSLRAAGSIYFELRPNADMDGWAGVGDRAPIISGGDYTDTATDPEDLMMLGINTAGGFEMSDKAGGWTQFTTKMRPALEDRHTRIAMAWDGTDTWLAVDGAVESVSDAVAFPQYHELWFGGDHLTGSTGSMDAALRGFIQYNQTLSVKELARITIFGTGHLS